MENVLHSFVAESDPQQQITYEDFDQIGKLDLEELDIKWQMAMLSVRINRFEKKAGRKMKFNNKDAARFDKKKTEEPKALLSVDSMLNWSDHEGKDVESGAAQVYRMIAGAEEDAANSATGNATSDVADDVSNAAAEFALMGISYQHLFPAWKVGIRRTSVPVGVVMNETKQSVPTGRPIFCWPGYYNHMNKDDGRRGTGCYALSSWSLFPWISKAKICNGDPRTMVDLINLHGGTVTFGGGDGKITGKGTIRTSKLDFENGIRRDYSNARTPQQNRVAERKNRTLIEAARTMLADSKLPTMSKREASESKLSLTTSRMEFLLILKNKEDAERYSSPGIKPDWWLSQDKYVQDMLKKFDMESMRTATTPYEASKPKSKDEPDDAVNVHLYRSMIGSLMYLTASRPDIMFAVSACSRHQVTPLTSNLNAVKKIFKYLKGQPKLCLWYPRDSPFVLEAYSDSDYAGSHGDRKSTTGGCQFLGKRLISWQCKKQTIVATSSTEAEYVAAANCCGQA
ncbi:uncharacterized mitochondrial protein-like protein [Tanacetum coccineum]